MQQPSLTLNMIDLDSSADRPLQFQLYAAMREAIVTRQLAPGGRLPSSRELAERWRVSRNTVLGAFDQLTSEGYLEGRQGAGTYITSKIPDAFFRTSPTDREQCAGAADRRVEALLKRISANAGTSCDRFPDLPLRPTIPSLKDFPFAIWEQCRRKVLQGGPGTLLSYGDPLGYWPLRKAIATHLRDARGVQCEPGQVVLCCGSQQGIFLAASLLIEPGEAVWMEDPGYAGARSIYCSLGAEVIDVPVDREGLQIPDWAKTPRLVHVSPSHQFPLGFTMSLKRRLALLEYADRTGAYIVEDDYDSEYRYEGRPLSSLQGLDRTGSVIYVGTFSKVMFPSLRLGYLVVPKGMVKLFEQVRSRVDGNPTQIEPATLALFIEEGHFARHIRKMRGLYGGRLEALSSAVSEYLHPFIELRKPQGGMNTAALFREPMDDLKFSEAARRAGVVVPALNHYAKRARTPPGLLMGFAAYTEEEICQAVRRLAALVD